MPLNLARLAAAAALGATAAAIGLAGGGAYEHRIQAPIAVPTTAVPLPPGTGLRAPLTPQELYQYGPGQTVPLAVLPVVTIGLAADDACSPNNPQRDIAPCDKP